MEKLFFFLYNWKHICFEISFPEDLVNKINIKRTTVVSIYLSHEVYSYKHIDLQDF